MSLPQLTLDTNCFINLFDARAQTPTSVETLTELMRMGLSGRADIAITTRVETDLRKDINGERKAEMLRFLNLVPVVGSVLRFDLSKWDSGDMFSSEENVKLADELQKLLFPGLTQGDKRFTNKVADVDHLLGHFMNKRDIFVTDDGNFIRKRGVLKSGFGIVVMHPADCLQFLHERERQIQRISLERTSIDPRFSSRPLRGTVTFDYSNNDGCFAVGEGQFLFETRWSKASRTSIYAYTDSPSIESLALVKGVCSLEEALDQSNQYDYSSRVRTPDIGQIIIWKNKNGILAASKIIEIWDDSRGDTDDRLIFEYLIRA